MAREQLTLLGGYLIVLVLALTLFQPEEKQEKDFYTVMERKYQEGHTHMIVEECYANGLRCTEWVACGDSTMVLSNLNHVALSEEEKKEVMETKKAKEEMRKW